MPKAEWGVKRTCLGCRERFYDLKRDPIICPKCGVELDISVPVKTRRAKPAAPKAVVKPAVKEDELIDEVDVDIPDDDTDDDDADVTLEDDDDTPVVVVKGAKSDDDDDDVSDLDAGVLLDDDDDDPDDDDDLDDDDVAVVKGGKAKKG